jgi:hypothetical protein
MNHVLFGTYSIKLKNNPQALVPPVGIKPTTFPLKVESSITELRRQSFFNHTSFSEI